MLPRNLRKRLNTVKTKYNVLPEIVGQRIGSSSKIYNSFLFLRHNTSYLGCRDIEFDLENDKNRCLYGLALQSNENLSPANSDVRRVAADSNDALGHCWFLSALATVSTAPGLVEESRVDVCFLIYITI